MKAALRTVIAAFVLALPAACMSIQHTPYGIYGKVNAAQAYQRYEKLAEELYAVEDYEHAFEKH